MKKRKKASLKQIKMLNFSFTNIRRLLIAIVPILVCYFYYPTPKSPLNPCGRLLEVPVATPQHSLESLDRFFVEYPSVLVSFMSEILLSIAILALLILATVELERGRAPKIIAIQCWNFARWTLLVTAVICGLLCWQGSTGPLLSSYFYTSSGVTVSKLLVVLASLFVLNSAESYIRQHNRHVIEFSLMILLGVLLLLLLVSSNNLMMLFLTLAGFSLTLYTLVMYDIADIACREASVKYFYLSTVSAGLIAFGTFLIYCQVQSAGYVEIRWFIYCLHDPLENPMLVTATLFILLGLLFKLSAFPGHLWAVEVYEGSPAPVMAFFILPVKIAVFVALLRLLNTALIWLSTLWIPFIVVAAIGSLLWGAFAALHERKITRFLGYASINQIGYLLLGLVGDSDAALVSAYYYLILYAVTTGGFLLVLNNLRRGDYNNFIFISDFRGLSKVDNTLCWNLSIFLFSMAGIPPLAGFFGKFYLLAATLNAGLVIPTVVAVAVSLVTTYYYLRIIKTFWFEEDISIREIIVLLSAPQRAILSMLELFLWISVASVPVLLPAIESFVVTLTICA